MNPLFKRYQQQGAVSKLQMSFSISENNQVLDKKIRNRKTQTRFRGRRKNQRKNTRLGAEALSQQSIETFVGPINGSKPRNFAKLYQHPKNHRCQRCPGKTLTYLSVLKIHSCSGPMQRYKGAGAFQGPRQTMKS